jgi:hypothetical protein
MGYISGYNLVFAAYQPNGSGRGIEQQPLPELAEGYYGATPTIDLVAGDEVIAYVLETVTWEDETVYVLDYDSVFWEGDKVHYEGAWVTDYDTTINDIVTSVGAVIGANEYLYEADYFDLLRNIIDGITIAENKVINVYTVSDTGGGAVAQAQRARVLESADIGYFKRKRFEKYG